MAEQHTLTTPASVTNFRVSSIVLDWDGARIKVVLRDSAGLLSRYSYSGATATTLMTQLNKANLSVSSLHKRILEQLEADGKIAAGDVTGSPD